jgi:hypothetical protein
MCYYRLYIFLGCGHSTNSSKPVSTCTNTSTRTKREIKAPTIASRHDSGVFFADSEPYSATEADEECTSGPSTPAQPQLSADTSNLLQCPEDQEPSKEQEKEEGGKRRCRERHYHPRQTFKLERLCLQCTLNRQKLLEAVNTGNKVEFQDWRWRVKYLSPVPEESRYTEWGAVGEVMGSWVKDWKAKGDDLMNVLRENVLEEDARDNGVSGVRPSRGGSSSRRRSSELGRLGARRAMGSS